MKHIHFTVGPSQLYPTVPKHIKEALREDIPSLSHRSEIFTKIYQATQSNLRKLMNIPSTHAIFFTSCALEGMERTIQNTVAKYSYHFVNGSFSREFYQIAIDLKKKAERFDVENGQGFDFAKVEIPKKTELICLVQNETSTGVAQPMDSIYQLKKRYPDTLLALDIVSSTPYVSVDFSKIDISIFSVQKGFGLPAGLGVLIVSEKALAKAQLLSDKGINIGSYHNFLKLHNFSKKYQTRETPNVMNIYLLGKVAEDMLKYGIAKIRKETEIKADLLYDFFATHTTHKPFVAEPYRSKTTIVIDVAKDSQKVIDHLLKQNMSIAQGYGKRKDMHIRIGNFPSHRLSEIKKLLRHMP